MELELSEAARPCNEPVEEVEALLGGDPAEEAAVDPLGAVEGVKSSRRGAG